MSQANPQLRPKAALITDPLGVITANVTEINPGEGALDVNIVGGSSGSGSVEITGPGGVNTAIVTADGSLDVVNTAPLVENVILTTGSLANGASAALTAQIPGPFQMLWAAVSAYCRVEAYSTAAVQAADAARPVTQVPTPANASGVISDGLLLATLALGYENTFGLNGDTPASNTIYFTITNLSGTAAAITVNIAYTNSLVPA
jgi:hypothetical protein